MSSLINLAQLPAPKLLASTDYETIRRELVDSLVAIDPDYSALLESDPAIKVLEAAAYRIMIERENVNDMARALMLAYTGGTDLDHIGVTYYSTPRLPGESDDDYKERLQLAYDAYSTAGSAASYEYHARTADLRVRDARATNLHAGAVLVSVMARAGDGTAPQSLLDIVDAALTAEKVRPLNDTVIVRTADIVPFTIKAHLTVYNGPSASVVYDQSRQALSEYVESKHQLGADMIFGKLEALAYVEGVKRVELSQPTGDIICDATQAPYCTEIEVTVDVV